MKKQIFNVYTKKKLSDKQILDIIDSIIDIVGDNKLLTAGSHRHDKRGVICAICSKNGKKDNL
jgi:uncharacterized protein YggL (DUF469 family)